MWAHPSKKEPTPMSVGPRIVFVRFLYSGSPKLRPWVAHVERVTGGQERPRPVIPETVRATSPELDGAVVWQLVSANNRQLARGTQTHETFERAVESAQAVVNAGESLRISLVSESGRGVYGWYGSIDGVAVLTCARWYVTERDRRYSIDLATRSLPIATLHSGSRLSHPELMGGDRATLS